MIIRLGIGKEQQDLDKYLKKRFGKSKYYISIQESSSRTSEIEHEYVIYDTSQQGGMQGTHRRISSHYKLKKALQRFEKLINKLKTPKAIEMKYEIEQINKVPTTKVGKTNPECEQCGELLKVPYFIIWKIKEKKKSISTICCKRCKNDIQRGE